jgi:hypothetical protein
MHFSIIPRFYVFYNFKYLIVSRYFRYYIPCLLYLYNRNVSAKPGKVFAVGYIKGICESSKIPLKLLIKIKHFIIRFCKLII